MDVDINAERQRLMALLAKADCRTIEQAVRALGELPTHQLLREPATGLVTLRGRIGGGGAPFNFGEATVTRASVKLATGEIGHAYALGRDRRKARISALIDAAFQRPDLRGAVRASVLVPLAREQADADRAQAEETAATKVDFFTLVRGED